MRAGDAADAFLAEFTVLDANSVAIAMIVCFRHPEWARAMYAVMGSEAQDRDWSEVYRLIDTFIRAHPITEEMEVPA